MSRRALRPAAALLCCLALGAALASPAWADPVAARRLFQSGSLAETRGQYLRAVELYRAAVKENPNYLEPITGLARCFFELEEYGESLAHVREAQRLDRGNLALTVMEARVRLSLGELPAARELFDRVLSVEPNNLEARIGLAQLEVANGRSRNAGLRYLESLRIQPENQQALLSLAMLSAEQGDREAARAYVELALRSHSNDPRVHYKAAQLAAGPAADAEALAQARAYLETALALDPGYDEARRLLAHVQLRQGEAQSAIEELRRLLETAREDPLLWHTLGMAYAAAGNTEEAVRSLFRAVHLRPEDEIARIGLENVALQRLPAGDPTRVQLAQYHLERSRLFRQRNLFARALLESRRAVQLDPEGKEAGLEYGDLYRVLGYPGKYRDRLEALRELGFTDPVILDDIERIASESYESVSSRWSIPQFDLDKARYRVAVFLEQRRGSEIHSDAGAAASAYFVHLLQRHEAVRLDEQAGRALSYEAAFRAARENGSDYFLLVRFDESQRSYAAAADLYLAGTGKALAAWKVFRTGNDRVLEALSALADRFASALPRRGRLLQRSFDEAVADLGRLDGLAAGDRLAIVKAGTVRLSGSALGLVVRDEDVLGTWTATGLDENLAEGRVEKRSFFDMINPGDELVSPPPEAKAAPGPGAGPPGEGPSGEPGGEADQGLLRRLLRLVGL